MKPFPSRHSKTIDRVESTSTAPVSSKTDPCASSYECLSLARAPLFEKLFQFDLNLTPDCVEASPSALKRKNSMRKPDCVWLVGRWVGGLSDPKVQECHADA